MISRFLPFATTLWLVGCASLPSNDTVRKANAELPQTWRASAGQHDETSELVTWWQGFSDPQLRALISRAIAKNYDLKVAVERSREAQALIAVARSRLSPEINVSGEAVRQRSHLPPPVGSTTDLNLGVSGTWTIDLFGGEQLATLATVARAAATEETRRDFEVALTANVASTYVQLRGLQEQLEILNRTMAARSDTVHLTKARYDAGLATDLDVARADTQLRETEALAPEIQRRIDNDFGLLAILSGETPESLDHALIGIKPIPLVSPNLPVQAPATLLERRPDLRAAARQIDAAAASLGSAKADLLPKFTLSFGDSVDRVAYHGAPGVTDNLFNVGLGIFWPLFNAGRIHANIAAHNAALKQAEYAYDQALLNALQDVESAYTDVRAQRERSARLVLAVDAAQRSSVLAQDLYQAGRADFLSVLDADTQAFDTERELAQAETDAAIGAVSLYRALGGGWSPDL